MQKALHMGKDYLQNPTTCNCENRKYLASIVNGSMITCDEVKNSCEEKIKAIQQILMKRK